MAQGGFSLPQQFVSFSKAGMDHSDGKTITLRQLDKWLKQAGILDGIELTNTETGVCFSKFKTSNITYQEFLRFLEDLSRQTGGNTYDELREKLMLCGVPGTGKEPPPIKKN